jgi:hypothetical protein
MSARGYIKQIIQKNWISDSKAFVTALWKMQEMSSADEGRRIGRVGS